MAIQSWKVAPESWRSVLVQSKGDTVIELQRSEDVLHFPLPRLDVVFVVSLNFHKNDFGPAVLIFSPKTEIRPAALH